MFNTNHRPALLFIVAILASMLHFSGCAHKAKQVPVVTSKHELQAQAESNAFFDVKPNQTPVSYLYAPGFKGTELLMGRYCPRFTAWTGEKITWRSGGHTIGQPHSAVNFPEVDLHKPTCFTLNPITAYINGIRRDLFPIAQRFFQDIYDFSVEDNPDNQKSIVNYGFNFSKANIGQHKDIKALHRAYEKHLQKFSDLDIVLYGDSRGAVTIFNFIAKYNPERVKAAVLEGIFDDMPHLVKHFAYLDKGDRAEKRIIRTMNFVLGSYNNKGPFPRDFAEIITDDIPLLFVTSLKDGLCCPQGAMYLYNRLVERGHRNVHLVLLKSAFHPTYMLNNKEDKQLYETTVHAFYKHYGLPHNSVKAAEGSASFAATRPSATEIKKMYHLPRCAAC